MYIGENFNVRFHDIFRFWKLLENNSSCGILHSEFIPNKNFRNMMISRSAQKIRDVPNAGGNSVISEVLSFEFLNKAVQAQLLKVRVIRCHSSLKKNESGGSFTPPPFSFKQRTILVFRIPQQGCPSSAIEGTKCRCMSFKSKKRIRGFVYTLPFFFFFF